MALQYNLGPATQPSSGFALDLQSILGGIQFGRDASGNFALSVGGLAVRRTDGTFVMLDEADERLIDVTPLVLSGIDPGVVRVPVDAGSLRRGDVLVVSDTPFSALFVLDHDGGRIRGLNPLIGQIVTVVPPLNLFFNFVVRAICLFDLLGG
jgi:hypothetical protein